MSWRIFTHHTLKTLLRVLQAVVFVLLPACLAYLHFAGLPARFHAPIMEAAARQGVDLEFSRVRLSLLQGPVLDNVSLRAENLPENHEIRVERAAVSVDWRRLLQGEVQLSALDLRGAELFFPVATREGVTQMLRLTKARVRLAFANGVVSVPLARFNLQGIDINATGQVRIGRQAQPPEAAVFPVEVSRFLDVLETVDFGPTPPSLDFQFSADTGDLAGLSIPYFELKAPEVRREDIALRDVEADGSYAGQTLRLDNLTAHGLAGGVLGISGVFRAAEGSGRFGLRSTIDPLPVLEAATGGKLPVAPVFDNPPVLQADVEFVGGEKRSVRVMGGFESGPLRLNGASVDALSAEFVWRDGDLYVRDITLKLPSGTIRADLMMRPDDVRLRLDCAADPAPLLAMLDEKAREDFAKMELKFLQPPHIQLEAAGPRLDPAVLRATGTLKLGRTSIHGSELETGSADVSFADLALAFTNMRVTRPEGYGTGAFTYDFGRKEVRLDNIRSTMTPFNVLQWADPRVAAETLPYRFKAPPTVQVSGVVGLQDIAKTRLRADFQAPGGLEYDLLERTLKFGPSSGSLDFNGNKIRLRAPSGRLFGGNASIEADITTGQPSARQVLRVRLDKVDFESLTRLYFDYKESKGVVSGRYDFSFIGGNDRSMRGEGDLRVENGNVFAIPVLGPLSIVLGTIVPGTGYQTARLATCDFTVADGVIRTDNLDIKGQGFSLIGKGKLFFLEDRMDFGVRINVQGPAGLLLYPVSKLFEYVSDGSLANPVWRPRILPKGGRDKAPGEAAPETKPSASAKRNGRA